MAPTTDYQILSAPTAEELVVLVKAQIANGWQVYGGLISINHTVPMNREDNFYQAMVKTTDLMAQMNTKLGTIASNTAAIKTSTASIDAKTPTQS